MPSLEEAREEAWRVFTRDVRLDHTPGEKETWLNAWDARGQYNDGVCFLCRWEGESVGVPGPYNKATEAGPFCERHNAGGQYDEQRIAALVAAIRGVYQDFQDGFNGAAMEGLRAIAGQPDA